MNITDPRFKYTHSCNTDIAATFRKHGFKPTTDAERAARQRKEKKPANVTQLRKVAK
jgi:hypothetical protein